MRLKRRSLVLAASLALAAIVMLSVGLWPSTRWARTAERASAERRWAQRQFSHYRIDVRDKGCIQSIEVHHTSVFSVAPNRCDGTARSVDELFDYIQRDGTVSQPCIYHGCACDDVIYIAASYDEQLGYPRRMIVRIRAEPNWRRLDVWRNLILFQRMPGCSQLMDGSKVVEVVTITPIAPS
jgi:hypothetical protein